MTMDTKSSETLNTILSKDIETLTDGEKRFLTARWDYLNDADKKRFAEVKKEVEKAAAAKLKAEKKSGNDEE